MKRIIALLLMTLAGAVYSANVYGPIEVTGVGKTEDEAKNNGFKQAVEYALGAAIVSEVEVQNRSEVAKNSVLKHSAGYVDKFKIVEIIEERKGRVSVTMNVWVKPSILNDYVMHKSKDSKKVEGETAGARISTYISEREQGDNFVNSVLRDFPHKAFNVKQGNFEVRSNDSRQMAIFVPYTISFNSKFLLALSGALKQVQDKECNFFCDDTPSFSISYAKQNDIIGSKSTYYYNDAVRPHTVWSKLTGISGLNEPLNSVKVKTDFTDFTGNAIFTFCTDFQSIPVYKRGKSYGIDGGSWKENVTLQIPLTESIKSSLPNVDQIKVSVVSPHECKNNY